MYFRHAREIWEDHPALVPGVLLAPEITDGVDVDGRIARFQGMARSRLSQMAEGEWPEIQAWRRAFAKMGCKPTQYRCAAESLLRRFRKDGALPRLHPLVDLCNAISLAFAVPIAAFDVSRVAQYLEVRFAAGDEHYLSFAGEVESPEPGEVIFADEAACAHARRWTHRQSGLSAIRDGTASVLIVMEAVHASAAADAQALRDALADAIAEAWGAVPQRGFLTAASATFEFG